MPTSVPRMSVTQAAQDLKARDAVLRGVPRGPLGRRQGRPRRDRHRPLAARHDRDDHQPPRPRRSGRSGSSSYDDAERQTRAALASLEAKGFLKAAAAASETSLVNDAAMAGRRAGSTPRSATWPCSGSTSSAPTSASDSSARRSIPPRSRRPAARPSRARPPPSGRSCSRRSPRRYGDRLALEPRFDDVTALVKDAVAAARRPGRAPRRPRAPRPDPEPAGAGRRRRGRPPRDREARPSSRASPTRLVEAHEAALKERVRRRSTGSSSTAPWASPPGPRSRS